MTSDRCVGLRFWDSSTRQCEKCETKYDIVKGFEFSENCGWSDDQYQAKPWHHKCSPGTFNDGSNPLCVKCRSCETSVFSPCNTTSDTVCCSPGEQILDGKCVPQLLQTTTRTTPRTTVRLTERKNARPIERTTESTTFPIPSSVIRLTPHSTEPLAPAPQIPSQTSSQTSHTDLTVIYVCLGILSALSLLCLFLVIRRRRKNHVNEEFGKRIMFGESLSKKSKDKFQQSVSYNIIKESSSNDNMAGSPFIAPELQNAPLKIVLNNLDVLEELVQVLDPDISGAKNTRHLAAQCAFSFAWINYAYSMKDRKSPLVAVLEGVVTKNPDWTVGHFAQMLSTIGRNDAVELLAKLPTGAEE